MNKILKVIAPILVLGLGAGGYTLLQLNKPKPEEKEEPARSVNVFVEPVRRTSVDLEVKTAGQVRARTRVDLVAQVGGRVVSVSPQFVEGGKVEPGVPLLTIEDTDYRLAVSQAEVQVARARLAVQQAVADADVARKQLKGAGKVTDLALKKPQVAEAHAQLEAARANLEQAKLNLARTHISLPFKGRVGAKLVDIGQYVTPGTRLGEAFATDIVEVRLPFTDTQLATLGLPVGYVAPRGGGPRVSFSARMAGRVNHWQGRLVRLDASVDPRTREVYGTAQVISPYDRNVSGMGMPLAVGMFVNAEVSGKHIAGAYVIPRDALRAGNRVSLVNDKGRLEIRQVSLVDSAGSVAVLSGGVDPGERVIVSTIRNPIRGMALKVIQHKSNTPDVVAGASAGNSSLVGG